MTLPDSHHAGDSFQVSVRLSVSREKSLHFGTWVTRFPASTIVSISKCKGIRRIYEYRQNFERDAVVEFDDAHLSITAYASRRIRPHDRLSHRLKQRGLSIARIRIVGVVHRIG